MITSPMGTSNVFGGRFLAVPEWAVPLIFKHGQPRDLQVLTCLVSMMHIHNKSVSASIQEIADASYTSKETVKRSLKWLSEQQIITTKLRQKPKPNTYIINYTQPAIGSPMTLSTPNTTPLIGSPMTLPTIPNGVTHDPIKMNITPAQVTKALISREIVIIESNSNKTLKKADGPRDKVEDMILGADVNEKAKVEEPVKRKPRPEVNDLASYFVYHPRSVMVCSYSFQDMNILRRTIKLLLDAGVSRTTVRQMIDKFFSTDRMRGAESPVLMFSSKGVQASLMETLDTVLDNTSPILSLMLNDFNREGLDLPWDKSSDEALRKVIIISGMDVCYRYPELVAQVIELADDFSSSLFRNQIISLNSLVKWHIGEEEVDLKELQEDLVGITLPKELLAKTRTTLRPAADTIVSAIYNYRRVTHGN
jgi:hypothetical protein